LDCELTVIVWIARPCVAHVAKLNYKVFECVHVQPYLFYGIKFDYLCETRIFVVLTYQMLCLLGCKILF